MMRSPQAAVLAGGSTPATPATPKESRGAARQAFERFDADRSGTLSKDECLAFIDDTGFYGITRGYLDGVWSVYDRNADGALDFKEFRLAVRKEGKINKDHMSDAQLRSVSNCIYMAEHFFSSASCWVPSPARAS